MKTHPNNGTPLSTEETNILNKHQWAQHIGENLGIWVSIKNQKLYVIKNNIIIWQTSCSTAIKGAGEKKDSHQTPRGWHQIVEKIGDHAPWGQIFRNRKPIGLWDKTQITEKSLILTRILRLDGLEEGKNKGVNNKDEIVDTYQRYIYIHGTNKEELIGTPSSHGCICLTNDDAITLYNIIPLHTKILITEE
ncbi:MAG TPA: L,D-transpeptidase [Candidatus Hydrogenedens sp.]|nr:L,D-transpeptidase [Candidatus Hydrogenedens sp.]HOL20657.1 L,D-transpeptidase [Candidatus Hydrogenedens sp.]HPP58699.1 L,D-transpeptidase [Candidatus Hydrogenedens sp.]